MIKIKFIRVIGALGLTMMMSSCFYNPYFYDPYYHDVPPYYSHGTYYPYGYYYYPGVQVYFQYSTGFYFYLSNNVWIRSRILPPHFRLNIRDRVPLHIESDKPYLKNPLHRKKYHSRPGIKLTPDKDRHERESLHKRYKEQQYNKSKQKKQDKEKNGKREKREKREKGNRRR